MNDKVQARAAELVIKVSTVKVSAEVHAAGCKALNLHPLTSVKGPRTDEWLAELEELGYPVKVCKCAK